MGLDSKHRTGIRTQAGGPCLTAPPLEETTEFLLPASGHTTTTQRLHCLSPTSPTSTATRSLTRTEQGAMGTLWRDRRRGWDAVGGYDGIEVEAGAFPNRAENGGRCVGGQLKATLSGVVS